MIYNKYSEDLLICELTDDDCKNLRIQNLEKTGTIEFVNNILAGFIFELVKKTGFSKEFVIEFNEPLFPGFFLSIFIWSKQFVESDAYQKMLRLEQEFENDNIDEEEYFKMMNDFVQNSVKKPDISRPEALPISNNKDDNDIKISDADYLLLYFYNIFEATRTLIDISMGKWGQNFGICFYRFGEEYRLLLFSLLPNAFAQIILTASEQNIYCERLNERNVRVIAEHGELLLRGIIKATTPDTQPRRGTND